MTDSTRIVSVLFVDLVGSTALFAGVGDDTADRIRRRCLAMFEEAVSVNRGQVVSTAGDGMVAAFEGSAADALAGAVAMQRGIVTLNAREVEVQLAIRIGISVGEVARDGDDWQGMPLVEAARLEGAAQPGQILVADLVCALVGSRGDHAFTSVGTLELKGLPEPLAASEVAWAERTPAASIPVPPAFDSPDQPAFVAREDELRRLRASWSEARDGQVRGAALVGATGVGKSRLAAAFVTSLRSEDAIVLHGHCDALADERCGPLAQALRWYVATATPEQVRDAVGPFGTELCSVVPLLRNHIPDARDVEVREVDLAAAFVSFFGNVSASAPVLLVLDPLDDVDGETTRLLDRLLSTPSGARLLVLTLSTTPPALPNASLDVLELTDLEPADTVRPGAPPTADVVVGREEPRRRIDRAVAESGRGRRSVLLVSGEAGIGKTTLLRTTLESTAEDAVVAWGTCWHGEGAPAFWPWTQAFDDLARSVGPDAVAQAAGDNRAVLSVLIRELGASDGSIDDAAGHRVFLLDAAVRWLEALARDRHVVIVLDDLQWADPSTLDLLDHLIGTPVRARLLILGTYRHDELADEFRAQFATIVSRVDHVHIEGLTVEEVEELITSISGARAAARLAPELHRRTGGHPLFVSELARLGDAGTSGGLPTAVSDAVARRLAQLPEATRVVLEAASVLGNRLLADVLADVTDQRPPDVLEGLEAAIEARIVRAESAAELWFVHDLFRETIYGDLGPSARTALHARVGAALEARHGRGAVVAPGDIARHLTLAVSIGDPDAAIRWATAAAMEERRRAAFAEAAAHLQRTRAAITDAGWSLEPDVLVPLLMTEADDLARSGNPDDARALLLTGGAGARTPAHHADLALAVQRLGAKFASRRDENIAQLETALDGVAGADPIREARLTAALARELQHSVAGVRLRAGELSERALELGRASGDDETLVDCLLARHDAIWMPGTGRDRAEIGAEIGAAAARSSDADHLAEGLVLEANGLLESGSPAFRPVLDRWFDLMVERDEPHDRYMILTRRAAVALIEDRRKDAERLMHDAAVMGEQIGEPDTGNVLMSQRVALSQSIEDPDELRVIGEDAVAWWTGAPVLAHSVAAGAYAAAGDLDAAARELATVAHSGGWQREDSYLRSVIVGRLAEAATVLGDTELCRELLDEIEPLAGSCGVNGAVVAFAGPFAHPAGILAAALGDHERAVALLEQSIATSRQLGAAAWARRGEEALLVLGATSTSVGDAAGDDGDLAILERTGRIWNVAFAGEQGSVNHVKGIADLVELVRHPHTEITALSLTGGAVADTSRQDVVDHQALDAYRQRLLELDTEIDDADRDGDAGRVEVLVDEKEQLLEEIRRTTGLGGRVRTEVGAPAEKARKAVSARIRDAISRLATVVPSLATHLDRSIRTGVRCAYEPPAGEAAIRWQIED